MNSLIAQLPPARGRLTADALIGKQTFPTGGQLTIVSGPSSGVTGASGAPLSGTTVLSISAKGRTITATSP